MNEKPTHKKEPALSQTSASQLVPALVPPWKRIPSQQDAFSLFTANRPNPYQQLITARQTRFVRPLETMDSITYFRTSVSHSELGERYDLSSRREDRHLLNVICRDIELHLLVILSNWCLIRLRKLGRLDNTANITNLLRNPPFSFHDRSDEFTTPKTVMCQHAVQLRSLFPGLPAWQI